jgi:hypothetical protein
MSDANGTFVERCLAGQADVEDLDQFEEAWHVGKTEDSLAEFLGFTEEEYALIVEQPALLNYVLIARKLDIPLETAFKLTKKFALSVGARLPDNHKVVVDWLKTRKRA